MTDLLERAAEAAYLTCKTPTTTRPMTPWVDIDPRMQTHFRGIARAVLAVAEPALFETEEHA